MSTAEKKILAAVLAYERLKLSTAERREFDRYGAPWRVSLAIGGNSPTPSQSAVFSRALRSLERKKLVHLTRWKGERTVSNVKLTDEGRAAAMRPD
jgi:hypothetical protein